jgi:BTB/POZ domain
LRLFLRFAISGDKTSALTEHGGPTNYVKTPESSVYLLLAWWWLLLKEDITNAPGLARSERVREAFDRQNLLFVRFELVIKLDVSTLHSTTFLYSKTMQGGRNETTVCLDVGGIKYKVSRTLIEMYPNTMLGRLVSDTWLQDPTREIFIDRDGDRFRYVLDYMRDGKACLPMSISRPSLVQELDFFGFENVPSEAINEGYSNFAAATRIKELVERHDSDAKARNTQVSQIGIEQAYALLAIECFKHYATTGRFDTFPFLMQGHETLRQLEHIYQGQQVDVDCFNRHLSKLGLQYKSGVFSLQLKALGT